jgi:hypothetical protein
LAEALHRHRATYTERSKVGTGVFANASTPDESKSPGFAQLQEVYISNGEQVVADYIIARKGSSDEVLNHNSVSKIKRKISAETAEDYGLDQDEAHLALLYAAASRELAQRTLTATPDEATRLKGMKRLASLTLDLYQRLQAARQLPPRLTDERQADLAGQLAGTSQHLRKLEKTLFGKARTPIDDLVTKAETRRSAYRRDNPEPEPETPRRIDRDHPHLAA